MAEILQTILKWLAETDWPATLQGIGAIWVALIAQRALSTWRRQLSAQKQIEFIGELTDTVNKFILLMSTPLSQLSFAKMGISSQTGIAFDYEKYENPGAIAFIEREGQKTSKKMLDELSAVQPVLSRMKSLIVKGQVFGMRDYSKCLNASQMLEWSYNQIEAFSVIVGSQNMNWEHPAVQRILENLDAIEPEKIKTNLDNQSKEIILFAKGAYEDALS
jgi:hypothetical protein